MADDGAELTCDVVVLSLGPGGYSAAFRAADLGARVILVERFGALGGVCLNVGCIPSKALLHVAAIAEHAAAARDLGLTFGKPEIDLARMLEWKGKIVTRLTGGLAAMARARKVEIVRGIGRFRDPHRIEVDLTDDRGRKRNGTATIVRFDRCIIAVGSESIRLSTLPDDPRIIEFHRCACLGRNPRASPGYRGRNYWTRDGDDL